MDGRGMMNAIADGGPGPELVTPTDDEMRECFEPSYCARLDPLGQIDDPDRGLMFDRWLRAHDRALAERLMRR